ncbi:transglutaminase-like cysteine peptidase [Caulobacter sp. NIBR2454]|uniref:transglutaminase-like cysteine peptidase n=1 Tax=Caulobacter sp. NIBR2454 TaxID=3015996 RepID=UPI0022B6BD87|nr:transglutaminase-like cysteine peptidase [Caulobacter sp. NIBR2454]
MAIATPAPAAYLDYCARAEGECGEGSQSLQVQREAQKVAWSEVFKRSADPAPAAIRLAAEKTDWAGVFAAANRQRAAKRLDIASIEVVAKPVTSKPKADAEFWARLNKINRKINHDLVRRTDLEGYGQEDYWAAPISSGAAAYGDCEDYVLEKRRALMAVGVPASALSVAVVTTPWGETHAVLLVDTDQGEYVLDNLSSFIAPWAKVGYAWRERQFSGGTFNWGLPATGASGGLMSVAAR